MYTLLAKNIELLIDTENGVISSLKIGGMGLTGADSSFALRIYKD